MSNVSANLAAVSGTAKAASGQLFGLFATNRNAAVRYLMVFDQPGAPNTGSAPVFEFPVSAITSTTAVGTLALGSNFFAPGWTFSNGITWGFSSTSGTYTAATAADHDLLLVLA
ncbi:MAG TPA: hypothetical protein VET26_10115 [Candidatus Sulfotelmatobacter sp.]|nr:hypothetical protein [Candidatus Sulfotelmatobacter sp.]